MHAQNIVHNDIKSLNILLDYDKNRITAVITDFGLSRRWAARSNGVSKADMPDIPSEAPKAAAALGLSVRYASPEIFGRMYMADGEQIFSEASKKSDV